MGSQSQENAARIMSLREYMRIERLERVSLVTSETESPVLKSGPGGHEHDYCVPKKKSKVRKKTKK